LFGAFLFFRAWASGLLEPEWEIHTCQRFLHAFGGPFRLSTQLLVLLQFSPFGAFLAYVFPVIIGDGI
jgi:hypothetical protein